MSPNRRRQAPHRWFELTFKVPEPLQDILVASLTPLGFSGFLQEGLTVTATLPSRLWNTRRRRELDEVLAGLSQRHPGTTFHYTKTTVAEQNWNQKWERSAGVIEATGRIIIKPRWKKLRKSDRGKIVLHIDPKMSFGTGHHETTRLSLVLLEEHMTRGARVLDMGCGTGVLSIAAVKLGARSALAIDNDDWALANAKENVKRNRVSSVRVLRSLPSRKQGSFGLILSNIDLQTNLRLLRTFRRLLADSGTLILSGLLSRDLPALMDALKGVGLAPVECIEENEWVAVALRNAGED